MNETDSPPTDLLATYSPLISAENLQGLLDNPLESVVLLDCRHDLMNHDSGLTSFNQGHIPQAQFWNMETDAVGTHTGLNGRHPLATREETLACFNKFGATAASVIVAYDAHGGQFAGRLWWLARWIGHARVHILDGGLQAWQALGLGALHSNVAVQPTIATAALHMKPALVSWINLEQVARVVESKSSLILDARAPARFKGEAEPIDPIAGHIPGALNRFYQDNLDAAGFFKSPAQLRSEFLIKIGHRPISEIVHQCGSGVTACHNLIAMEVAGLSGSHLYPGSWSEWCNQQNPQVSLGSE